MVFWLKTYTLWGNAHIAGFTSSDQAIYGPFQSRFSTALFWAPTTWTCHLANQRGALSHAQRAGSVYKARLEYQEQCTGRITQLRLQWSLIDSRISDRRTRQRSSRQTANPSEASQAQAMMWGRYPPHIDTSPHNSLLIKFVLFWVCPQSNTQWNSINPRQTFIALLHDKNICGWYTILLQE
jgi:hypothetical protein